MSDDIKIGAIDAPGTDQRSESKQVNIDPGGGQKFNLDEAYARAIAALGADEATTSGGTFEEQITVTPTGEIRQTNLESQSQAPQGGDANPPDVPEQQTESEDRKRVEKQPFIDEPGDNVARQPDSERWAALYERDRQLQQQSAQVKRQLDEAKAESERLRAQQAEWAKQVEALQAIKDGRALEGLKGLGVEYSELTRQILQSGDQPNIEPMKRELTQQMEELKSQIEQIKSEKARVEAEAVRVKELEIVRTQITEGGEQFELLRSFVPDWTERVHAAVYTAWEEAGRPERMPLTPTEIASKMEAALLERLEAAKGTSKIRNLYGAPAPVDTHKPPNTDDVQRQGTAQKTATLTNSHASTADRAPENKLLSEAEYRARALALLD